MYEVVHSTNRIFISKLKVKNLEFSFIVVTLAVVPADYHNTVDTSYSISYRKLLESNQTGQKKHTGCKQASGSDYLTLILELRLNLSASSNLLIIHQCTENL